MKKQHFSLVELLTVIAVIAILAGILIPTVGAIKESGKAAQALTEVKGIHLAIKSFQNDHKYLPDMTTDEDRVYIGAKYAKPSSTIYDTEISETVEFDSSKKTINGIAGVESEYLNLFDRLCYAGSEKGGTTVTETASNVNKKKKKYLTPPAKYFSDLATEKGFRDPWGRPYIIYLDTDYNGSINTELDAKILGLTQKDSSGNGIISDTVGVMSLGKNSLTKLTSDIDAEDLCTSWQ